MVVAPSLVPAEKFGKSECLVDLFELGGNEMKFVKELPYNGALTGLHAIYELSDDELNWERKQYLVNRKYSEYAMCNMEHEMLIENAVKEKEYVYGTGFCDTIAECELYYKNACLEVEIIDLKRRFNDLKNSAENALKYIESF